jgi:hypothetical protein
VLTAVERTVRQFRTRKELWPLRVPGEPLSLDVIVRRALDQDAVRFDLRTLRSRTLLSLTWDDGSRWDLWTLALEAGVKLYCDTSHDESRILASARRDSEIDPDRLFLEVLAESGGEAFGIGMEGGPPSAVRSTIDDRSLVVDFFVSLFEVTSVEGDIRTVLGNLNARGSASDFHDDVDRWLKVVLRK